MQKFSPSDNDLSIRQLVTQEAGVSDDAIVFTQALLDRKTGQCTGKGFVQFKSDLLASEALEALKKLTVPANAGRRRYRVEFAWEYEKDKGNVYLWNLPLKCSDDWIEKVLLEDLRKSIAIAKPILSVRAIESNPVYSVGFICFSDEADAQRCVECVNELGLELRNQYACPGRLAAKIADKKVQRRESETMESSSSQREAPPIRFEDIAQPNPVLSAISELPFQLKDAESPFKWNAQSGSDRIPEDVIRKLLERLKLEPMLSAAYQGMLAAYHSAISPSSKCIDFRKSRKYLKCAMDCRNPHQVNCEFVLEAIALNLDMQQNKTSVDFADRVRALGEMWNNPDDAKRIEIRANAFYIKALAFFHQGINKYGEAEEAARTCLSIRPENFMCVYLLAYILARLRRYNRSNLTPADPTELVLWERSLELAQQQQLREASQDMKLYFYRFLINYAEAILSNQDFRDACLKFANETFQFLMEQSAEVLEEHYRIPLKCEKVFRLLRVQSSEAEKLSEILLRCKNVTRNAQLLYILAKLVLKQNDEDECERLLIRAQEVALDPGHIWVDVFLQEFRAERPDRFFPETILEEYDTMIAKYRDFPRYVAVSLYLKGEFMCRSMESYDDGFNLMVRAVVVCPDVRVHFPAKNRNMTLQKLCEMSGRLEVEAWFRQHMMAFDVQSNNPERIKQLYEEALSSDQSDHQLVHENLGLLCMSLQEFEAAEQSFRKLQTDNERKCSLLSSALLKQVQSKNGREKREMIIEALRLNNAEACQPAQKLLDDRLKQKLQDPLESIRQKYSPEDADRPIQMVPWLFSRDSYELLALISIASQGLNGSLPDESSLIQTDLQKSRLALERLNQLKSKKDGEYYHTIMKILREAKEAMDGLWAKSFQNSTSSESSYFPYGFNYAKKGNSAGRSVIQALNNVTEENRNAMIKEKLTSLLKPKGSTSSEDQQRLDATRELLSIRECKVFSHQKPFAWLVIWQDVVNWAKHRKIDQEPWETFVPNCLKALGADLECVESIAHMAAEFVEETRIIFDASTEDLRVALGASVAPA